MCSVRIFNNIACLSATVANSQTYNYNMIDLRNLGIAAIAVATFGMPCSARKKYETANTRNKCAGKG